MFNLLIYGFGTTLEKMTREIAFTSSPRSSRPRCSGVLGARGLAFWMTRLLFPASTYQTFPPSGVCSQRTFQISPEEHALSWELRQPLAD